MQPALDSRHTGIVQLTDDEFNRFRELIYRETGISLRDSKRILVASRLAKCLRRTGAGTFTEYYDLLMHRDPKREERRRMVNCMTTNKTSFFREEAQFGVLRRFLAARAQSPARKRTLRIWSAASSTGEEPYSIAMTVSDVLNGCNGWDVRILASDIDTDVLSAGEAGIYDMQSLENVPAEMRRKYFLRGTGQWEGTVRVKPELRQMITFRQLNLIGETWPLQSRFDAIFCRNVIIYFDRDTQRTLFARMVPFLDPDGLLFLGHSETLHSICSSVRSVAHAVYCHKDSNVGTLL